MPASPSFAINGGATDTKVSIAAGGALQAILASIDGARSCVWTVVRTDDTSSAATLTAALVPSGSVNQQVDLTGGVGVAGTSGILSVTINNGVDSQTGESSSTMTQTVKWYVPTDEGLEVMCVGELEDDNRESDATFGGVVPINAVIRNGGKLGDFKASVRVATAAALPAYTAAGSGSTKTLTMNAVGVLTIDGVATVLGNRVLHKNAAASHVDHGIFKVTTEGTGAVAAVLTRDTDANASAEMTAAHMVPVEEGTANADQIFICTTNNPIVLDTTALAYVNWGVLAPLVTAALRGTVSPLGAADTTLCTDGATPGLQYRTYLCAGGGTYPATGTAARLSHGATVHGLDTAGTGTAPVLDWGSTTADHITVGGNDADLDGVDLVAGAAGTAEIRAGATTLASISATAIDFPSATSITATGNPTWNTGTGAFTWGTATVQFGALVVTPSLSQAAPAVDVAATNLTLRAQAGGAASAAIGKAGGIFYGYGGTGGAGTAGLAAGAGGAVYVTGGTAGANGGGGGAGGGALYLRGGSPTGAGARGAVYIGDTTTATIALGNAADDPTIDFPGQGNITATGNPLWDVGTQGLIVSGAGYVGVGSVPGGGGNARAAGGVWRMYNAPGNGGVTSRNAADSGDVSCMHVNASNRLCFGIAAGTAAVPDTAQLNATTTVYVGCGGAGTIAVSAASVQVALIMEPGADIRWQAATVAPTLYQNVDATAGVTGDDLTIAAQNVSDPAGNAFAGDLGLRGGQGTVHANNKDGNIWLHVAPASWNVMEKGMFVADCATAPTGNPVAGGYLYSTAGAGTWRGSGGTVTTFGPAEPHCPKCGRDCAHSWENEGKGWKLTVCMWCLTDALGDVGVISKEQR